MQIRQYLMQIRETRNAKMQFHFVMSQNIDRWKTIPADGRAIHVVAKMTSCLEMMPNA